MKKIFATMLALAMLLTVNISHAAKVPVLADIDAENFFRNMGYEVDCSYWERKNGKIFFEATLPEDPFVIAKDFGNVEVFAEKKGGRIVELRLYMRKLNDTAALTAAVAKVIKALDAEAFTANQAAIEQGIMQFMNSPQLPDDSTVTITAERKFSLHKEEMRGRILAVHISAT